MTRISLSIAALFAAAVASSAEAACDWKPERAVNYVIPWGAGGGTDANSRFLAILLEQRFGVPFNAANRTGGNGVVGHSAIALAEPDGYTIGSATVEITTMQHLGLTELNQTSISPIALVDISPAGFFVAKGSPFTTLEQVIEHARANPGTLTGSGTSQGGIWHLALAGLLQKSGLSPDAIRWVPSEGAAPALQELIAGGVDVATPALSEGGALAAAGEIRPLAVMHSARIGAMPDVATTAELGADWQLSAFILLAGPAGLPAEIACSYEKAALEIFASPEWAEFKASRGAAVVSMGSAELTTLLDRTSVELGATMRSIGIAK